MGRVWPGYVIFPDFLAPKIKEVWEDLLTYLSSDLEFDGIWLDMNEIANFCDGECLESICLIFSSNTFEAKNYVEQILENWLSEAYTNLPYIPGK